jgi:protein phosphatase
MGGHQAGEIASMTAGQTLQAAFSHFAKGILDDPRLALGRTLPFSADLLVKAVRLANRAVVHRADANREFSGMGTTIVAVSFEADIMSVAHVGDSRAYRIRSNALEPLTSDHSWVAEMQRTHNLSEAEANQLVGRNVITRALGVKDVVEVDLSVVKVGPGDQFLLCSDGLCGFADDDEIFAVARRTLDDIAKTAANLVQMANDRGGADNVSVIVIEVLEAPESPLPEVPAGTFPAESEEQRAAEDDWLGRFQRQVEEPPPVEPAKPEPPNRKVIIAVLAVFAVTAFLLIYFATRN